MPDETKAISLENLIEFKEKCDLAYEPRKNIPTPTSSNNGQVLGVEDGNFLFVNKNGGGGGGGGGDGNYVTVGGESVQEITGTKRFTSSDGIVVNSDESDLAGNDTKYKSYSIEGNYAGDSPFKVNIPYNAFSSISDNLAMTMVVKNGSGGMNLNWVKNVSELPSEGVYLICNSDDPEQETLDNITWIAYHSANSINNSFLFPYPDGSNYYYRVLKNGTIVQVKSDGTNTTTLSAFSYIKLK